MSDDFKPPKGPLLPDPKDPKRADDTRTNIIDIKAALKERKEKRLQKKQAKTNSSPPGKKKPLKTTVEKVNSNEPVDPIEKIRREERKKYNDKKLVDRLRTKIQGMLARFATETLPKRTTSAGNNPTNIPRHPLTSKMTGRDPNVSADTAENPNSRPELELQLANKKQLMNQNQNISTPTPKPPGG